jgi:uncharacterized protein YfbU (UPF0304 family)
MATERFEMRIDSELLDRLDSWRMGEDDTPSRAEAIRRLIEAGVAHDNRGRSPLLSDGEKLITLMLADVIKGLKIETETNVDLVQNVIYGGHYWALGWEMSGVFHGHVDKRSQVSFVVDVLDMWSFLEEAFDKLDEKGKVALEEAAGVFGKDVRFPGFDGNNETEYMSIARFMITDLSRFSRFADRKHDLNSHHPTLDTYARMYRAFEPIRKGLIGRSMTGDEMATVINAGWPKQTA